MFFFPGQTGVAKKNMFFSFQTKQATICSKNALLPLRPNVLINTFVEVPTCVMNSIIFESMIRTRGSSLVINWSHYEGEVS